MKSVQIIAYCPSEARIKSSTRPFASTPPAQDQIARHAVTQHVHAAALWRHCRRCAGSLRGQLKERGARLAAAFCAFASTHAGFAISVLSSTDRANPVHASSETRTSLAWESVRHQSRIATLRNDGRSVSWQTLRARDLFGFARRSRS